MRWFGGEDPDEELIVQRRHWDGLRGAVIFTVGLTLVLTLLALAVFPQEGIGAVRRNLGPAVGLAGVHLWAYLAHGRKHKARPLQEPST